MCVFFLFLYFNSNARTTKKKKKPYDSSTKQHLKKKSDCVGYFVTIESSPLHIRIQISHHHFFFPLTHHSYLQILNVSMPELTRIRCAAERYAKRKQKIVNGKKKMVLMKNHMEMKQNLIENAQQTDRHV